MSVSAMVSAAFSAGGGPSATLALSSLSSSRTVFGGTATAGVRLLTNGDVEEINFSGTWTPQNSGTEWIDDGGATASDYEVQLVQSTFSGGGVFSGPTLSTYHTISTTRQWTLSLDVAGSSTFTGTMTVREIADTGNSVSASVFLTVTVETL